MIDICATVHQVVLLPHSSKIPGSILSLGYHSSISKGVPLGSQASHPECILVMVRVLRKGFDWDEVVSEDE